MTLKQIFTTALLGLSLLVAVLLYRTLTLTLPDWPVPEASKVQPDPAQLAANLSKAVQFKTISFDHGVVDKAAFDGFVAFLAQTYPELHQQASLTRLNDYTLLFYLKGRDRARPPVLWSAHYDVVPVIPGTEKNWSYAPFAGTLAEGYIWGRGTMDDKGSAIAMLEAVSWLLRQEQQPGHDLYLALTHDEEIGSTKGSQAVANWFKQQGIQLGWTLDEGSFVLDGMVPGISQKVASINIAEKGYMNVELVASAAGGHSSMPPGETAVTILAQALLRLKEHQLPASLDGLPLQFYQRLAPAMGFTQRLLVANSWLFGPLIEAELAKMPAGNAMLRTTYAPTMLSGSVKSNVLPIEARATVNLRIHPRDTVEAVIAHLERVIADPRIRLVAERGMEASPVSAADNKAFRLLEQVSRKVHGDVLTVPGLTLGATDSRFYSDIAQANYRYAPMVVTPQDLTGFHGTDERISQDNLVKAVQFYAELLLATTE
ncbi:M20 family peptidase [Rheinheimera sp.]|uniref:M20 family peptidase n=1 Tax=Rheinheimera sp. TaxID=1869214 RepID=UPI00307D57B5